MVGGVGWKFQQKPREANAACGGFLENAIGFLLLLPVQIDQHPVKLLHLHDGERRARRPGVALRGGIFRHGPDGPSGRKERNPRLFFGQQLLHERICVI